jgi:hypothetical protein
MGGGVKATGADAGGGRGFDFSEASRRMVSIESSTDSVANPDPEGGFVVIPDTLLERVSLPGIRGGCQARPAKNPENTRSSFILTRKFAAPPL